MERLKIILLFLIFLLFASCSNIKNSKFFFEFESNPKIVQIDVYKYEKEKEEFYNRIFLEFDKNGRIINHKSLNSNKSLRSGGRAYKYYRFRNIVEQNQLYFDGSLAIKSIFKLNKNQNVVYSSSLSEIGENLTTNTYEYDISGNLEEVRHIDGEGNIHRTTYEYFPEEKKKIRFIYNIEGGLMRQEEIFSDEAGNDIELRYYYPDIQGFTHYTKSTYNQWGDRISHKKYSLRDNEHILTGHTRNKYIYDKRGNCIEEKLFVDEKLHSKTTTKIIYYKK